MSPSELPGELRARLLGLFAEAREHGAERALRPLLHEFLESAEPSPATADDDAPVPARFGMIGDSPKMRAVFDLIERVAPADVPVLISGETGTGKELVARAIHDQSRRRTKAFLAENCAAVSPHLLESELFGHKKGSFTGAVVDRKGHFQAAHGGTVFLDEIGDMPLDMQAKLLRVLQDGELRPVGANETVKVDVRVLGATNKDLVAMTRAGTFREDLYFRLNVIRIELPPLREREGDVEFLVRALLRRQAEKVGREVRLSPEARAALVAWTWPGNVRELENELLRAVAMSSGTIEVADLSDGVAGRK